MDSLYDLFNRKKDVCALEERFEYEDQSAIMEDIIQESNMQFIQIQADAYVNDLLIEEAIYDDFNEGVISSLLESGFSEKKDKLIKFIQDKWAKLKAWFGRVVENVKNFFRSLRGSSKGNKDTKSAMKALANCEKEITTKLPNNLEASVNKWEQVLDKSIGIYNDHADEDKVPLNDAKLKILNAIGVNDKKEIRKAVHKIFWTDKSIKTKIKDLDNHDEIVEIVRIEKDILDLHQKALNEVNEEHKKVLVNIKNDHEDKDMDKRVALLNYHSNITGLLISGLIGNVKKIAAYYRNIIKMATGADNKNE